MHSLRLAARRLRRHPGFTLLNASGLAIGLACALLALFYIRDETRVDRFHADGDRIVAIALTDSARTELNTWISYPVATAMAELPEVEATMRVSGPATRQLRVAGGQESVEVGVATTEADFFSFFSFPLVAGAAPSALADPNDLVLTESTAQALFGDADPVGQTVEYFARSWTGPGEWKPQTVTAIAQDPPSHTTIKFGAVNRFEILESEDYGDETSWTSLWLNTYARLSQNADVQAFIDALPERMATVDPNNAPDTEWERDFYTAVSLPSVYFATSSGRGFSGRSAFMNLFGLIALAVLVIAILNYVNLATARGTAMAKEVGVRKAVGAGRGQVTRQLLAEALLLVAGAFGLAVGLVLIGLPLFNTFFGKEITIGWDAAPVWAGAVGLMVVVGLAAGAYPALVLSRFRPARVLRGGVASTGGGSWLRRGLVVTQFAATMGLLVFTGFVFRQLDHVESRYNLPDHTRIAIVSMPTEEWTTRTSALKDRLLRLPGVQDVAAGSSAPGGGTSVRGVQHEGQPLMMTALYVDRDYMRVMDMPMTHEATQRASDPPFRLFVNETLFDRLGTTWSDGVLASPSVPVLSSLSNGDATPLAGVLTDFPWRSLRDPIDPTFLIEVPDTMRFNYLVANVVEADVTEFQAALTALWTELGAPASSVRFMDEYVDKLYAQEHKLAQLVTLLALVALFIACLGLFGLAAHAAMQKRKEISIRKVLGASVAALVGRLTREFALLVAAAFALATPLAYLLVSRWLDGFVDRTPIDADLFAIVLGLVLLLALVTVSFHAWQAATRNPADVLRDE